jgi:hypothetical protein
MSSSSSWDSVVDESAPLQNLNRTVIGSDILFSFSMGAALVRDVISSLPSPLYVIITDDIVHELYGRQLVRAFVDQGARAEVYVLPNGESYKNRHSKELIEDWMVSTLLKRAFKIEFSLGGLRLHASHCCCRCGRRRCGRLGGFCGVNVQPLLLTSQPPHLLNHMPCSAAYRRVQVHERLHASASAHNSHGVR